MVRGVTREPEIFVREESGPRRGRVHALAPGVQTIGRDQGAAVSLAGGDVSRFHASLEVGADAIAVVDLGSKNGVFKGGAPIVGRTALGHGDVIEVGGISLSIHHPGAQVDAALRRRGEVTVTRASRPAAGRGREGLGWPLAAAAVFAALVAAQLLWQ